VLLLNACRARLLKESTSLTFISKSLRSHDLLDGRRCCSGLRHVNPSSQRQTNSVNHKTKSLPAMFQIFNKGRDVKQLYSQGKYGDDEAAAGEMFLAR